MKDLDYELLDAGGFEKLERFGDRIVIRPDPTALWDKFNPKIWTEFDYEFNPDLRSRWMGNRNQEIDATNTSWKITYNNLVFKLKLSPFKHVGIFPEQVRNWEYLLNQKFEWNTLKVLNLFGYTGAVSVVMASMGANVTHVDASKPAMDWCSENIKLNDLNVRLILDDAGKFADKEVRRENTYDVIILDPPAFGRDPKGKVFKFEEDVMPMLKQISKLLSRNKDSLIVFNSYSLGYSPSVIGNMIATSISDLTNISIHELSMPIQFGKFDMSMGIVCRAQR